MSRTVPGRVARLCAMGWLLASALPVLTFATNVPSDARLSAHPRTRFPLALFVGPARDPRTTDALRTAVGDWNALFESVTGVAAFRWHDREAGADVIVRFVPVTLSGPGPRTHLTADEFGTIELPVLVELPELPAENGEPVSPTGSSAAGHELGHVLGLSHSDDVESIMCCAKGGAVFRDPELRRRHLEARQRAEVRSALRQLLDVYPRAWRP